MIKWWLKQKLATKLTIIGLVTAALISSLVLVIYNKIFYADKREIKIENVAIITSKGKLGIDIVHKSLSSSKQSINTLTLIIIQPQAKPFGILEQNTYSINQNLEIIDHKDSSKSYKAGGSFSYSRKGNWKLTLNIPIREELEPQQSKNLILLFPDTLICNSISSSVEFQPKINRDTIPFRSLLITSGKLTFNLEETGSIKKNSHYTDLNFSKY